MNALFLFDWEGTISSFEEERTNWSKMVMCLLSRWASTRWKPSNITRMCFLLVGSMVNTVKTKHPEVSAVFTHKNYQQFKVWKIVSFSFSGWLVGGRSLFVVCRFRLVIHILGTWRRNEMPEWWGGGEGRWDLRTRATCIARKMYIYPTLPFNIFQS